MTCDDVKCDMGRCDMGHGTWDMGVMMDAGSLRRNFEYPEGYSIFTFGDLKKEIPFPSGMVVVWMKGSVIRDAVAASRARAYKDPPEDWGGYMQLDDGFKWDAATNAVTHVNLEPLGNYVCVFVCVCLCVCVCVCVCVCTTRYP